MKNRVDNNGAEADVVFWSTGELVAEDMDSYEAAYGEAGIKGNCVWQVYDVVIQGDTEYYELIDRIISNCNIVNNKDDGSFLSNIENGVGTNPGDYKQEHVSAFLALHAEIEALANNAQRNGAESILTSYPTANALRNLNNQYVEAYNKVIYNKVSVKIKPGYYTIRSMMNFNDGQIKALGSFEINCEGMLHWHTISQDCRDLWKVEVVEGSDDEYRLVNMYRGHSFNALRKSANTQLEETNSTMYFEYIGNGVAPVTNKNVTFFAIRSANQYGQYSYVYCGNNYEGTGETSNAVGWTNNEPGSYWYFEEVDEATANKWMHGEFKVNGISYNIIGKDEVEVATCCLGEHSGLNMVEIPANVSYQGQNYKVTNIGDNAFYRVTDLYSLKIGENVREISLEAFCYCSNLSSVTLPSSMKTLAQGAFSRTAISELVIPEGVTYIGKWVADRCPNLETVYLPSTLETIGFRAFEYNDKLTNVYSYILANELFAIDVTVFNGVDKETCLLNVPYGSKDAYSSTAAWNEFANIIEFSLPIEIIDGTLSSFENIHEREVPSITYTRTLPNLKWNALYVPFEIPVAELAGKYDVAYVNNIHSYDNDDNGVIDELTMEVIKIKSGTLKANYPYMIKAKTDADRQMNVMVENTTLHQTKSTTLTCSSVYTDYTITGIYSRMTSNELPGCLAISTSGAWQPIASGSYLNPFRLYMTITDRDDSPVKVEPAALSRIRIRAFDEDMETEIENVKSENGERETVILDLSGRRVQNPTKGGVYIVNGKKVVY